MHFSTSILAQNVYYWQNKEYTINIYKTSSNKLINIRMPQIVINKH
jgi:hypothetical protein